MLKLAGAIIKDAVWIRQARAALSSIDLHIAEYWPRKKGKPKN
jgi:hypothetical protein